MAKYKFGYNVGGPTGRRELMLDTGDFDTRILLLDMKQVLEKADDALFVAAQFKWQTVTDILPSGRVITDSTVFSKDG